MLVSTLYFTYTYLQVHTAYCMAARCLCRITTSTNMETLLQKHLFDSTVPAFALQYNTMQICKQEVFLNFLKDSLLPRCSFCSYNIVSSFAGLDDNLMCSTSNLAHAQIENCARDGGEEFFTEIHCV